MRRTIAALVAVLALAGSTASAAPERNGIGYFASDNVEYIGFVPLENDTSGARIVGKHMYLTTSRGLSIYDLDDPLAPQRVGFLPLPQSPYFVQEDVDTNGKILLVGSLGHLHVVDVEDKSNPQIIGSLPGGESHTHTCVLACTYSYAAYGQIVDLRDPTNPRTVGDWTKSATPLSLPHDVTEVAPGLVVTSSYPIFLLDARKDPAHPKVIAIGNDEPEGMVHSNVWPRRMRDRFLLVGTESGGPYCGPKSAAFMTWDASRWRERGTFEKLDEYRVKQGLYTDGDSPVNQNCLHWFQEHPDFRNGGLVAVAWYEHGTRFLHVSPSGDLTSKGYFLPLGGAASASYWITDEIVYSVDYNRGVDIIRFTG